MIQTLAIALTLFSNVAVAADDKTQLYFESVAARTHIGVADGWVIEAGPDGYQGDIVLSTDGFQKTISFVGAIDDVDTIRSFSCIKFPVFACLVTSGKDVLNLNLTLVNFGEERPESKRVPVTIDGRLTTKMLLGDVGWLVVDEVKGELALVRPDGTLETPYKGQTWDVKQTTVELEYAGYDRVALRRIKADTVINDNRVEKATTILGADAKAPVLTVRLPRACSFLATLNEKTLCTRQIDGNLALYEINNSDSSYEKLDIGSLGTNLTTEGDAAPFGRGLIVPVDYQGMKTHLAITIDDDQANANICDLGEKPQEHTQLSSVDPRGKRVVINRWQPHVPQREELLEASGIANLCNNPKRTTLFQPLGVSNGDTYETQRLKTEVRNVPITLVRSRKPEGQFQGTAIISVYGAFNILLDEPPLGVSRDWYLANGGTMVYAHVRGGGGFGNAWRQAGYGAKKVAAMEDLFEVIQTLTATKGIEPGKILMSGESAGGILAGSAAFIVPNFVKGAILYSPCLILWDDERGACTETNEFGDPTNPADMEQMKRISPGHQLYFGSVNPPLLIFQFENDPVVPSDVTSTFLSLKPSYTNADVVTLSGQGHGSPQKMEQAKRLLEKWKIFVREQLANSKLKN